MLIAGIMNFYVFISAQHKFAAKLVKLLKFYGLSDIHFSGGEGAGMIQVGTDLHNFEHYFQS